MKKVRVVQKQGLRALAFPLFSSPESLYVWLQDEEQTDDVEAIELQPREFIEAEWEGCEFVYEDDGTVTRLDAVRLVRASHSANASGTVVSAHRGWVKGGDIPFSALEDDSVVVSRLAAGDDQLDLNAIFQNEEERGFKP